MLELCWAMEQGTLSRVGGLSLEKEIGTAIRSKNVFLKGFAYRYKALLLKRQGASDEKIMQALKRSIKWLEDSGSQWELTRTKMELASLHLSSGSEKKARDIMEGVAGLIENMPQSKVPENLRFLLKDLRIDRNLLREILKLAEELVTIRDYRESARTIISTANQITGAERGAIFHIEGDNSSRKLTLKAAKNLAMDDIDRPGFSDSMKMIRETADTGEGRIRSVKPDRSQAGRSREIIRDCICVPMKLRGEIVGVLYHDNRFFSSAFREADLEIFNYFFNYREP